MGFINGCIIFSLIVTLSYFTGLIFFLTDYDPTKCEMTYMFEYPQFVRIPNPADAKHQRYGLYAYSEGRLTERARNMKFDGIPVLFIPGSGGSHKQVRSFASVALRKSINSRLIYHFDYFTVDFNNELSGLNGALLDGQLDYVIGSLKAIISLYENDAYRQESVVIMGHSMGGVIAKVLLSKLPFETHLVPIVITLSSPLKRPVLALDQYFPIFYESIHRNTNDYKNTTFVSLAGGFNDFMVPAHLTDSGDVNVVATQIPKCWISNDHLSIVWCKQLILAVTRALFDSIDPRTKAPSLNKHYVTSVFRHHLVQHTGITFKNMNMYTEKVLLAPNGEWHNSEVRQYSVRFPKGSREVLWYTIPLILVPNNEYLTLVAINVKSVDWVYVCAAVGIRNNQRFCAMGNHLTHLSEISPSVRHKRRTLRINLHDLKMNYSSASHVAIRIVPTDDFAAFHVDVVNPRYRNIVFDQGMSWLWFMRHKLVELTEPKAIHYNIELPQWIQITQSYALHLESVCSGQGHHATVSLIVPWGDYNLHKFYTDALQEPLVFRLYKPRPINATTPARIQLTLDPSCRYSIDITGTYNVGAFVRYYSPMLLAYVPAVLLMVLRHQMIYMKNNRKCSFMFTALQEAAKPYYILTTVKILEKLDFINFYVTPMDAQTLFEEGLDMFVLPIILYAVAVGIVWFASIVLSLCLIFFETLVNKCCYKFFLKTFAGRAGWTSHIAKVFDKVPGAVACVLITMCYTTCGGLAVILATIFYFLKLAEMAQGIIEDIVKEIAKSIKHSIWETVKAHWCNKKNTVSLDEPISIEMIPNKDKRAARIMYEDGYITSEACTDSEELESSDEITDNEFEEPLSFRVRRASGTQTVNGGQLVDMLLPKEKSEEENNKEQEDSKKINLAWILDVIEHNEIYFHFTIFLLYLIVAIFSLPSVLTWARNYRFSKVLEPDPIFTPALIMCICAAPLWQFDFPAVNNQGYVQLSGILYYAAIVIIVFGSISIYRVPIILAITLVLVIIHQLLVPREKVTDEASEELPDRNGDWNVEAEYDAVKTKME